MESHFPGDLSPIQSEASLRAGRKKWSARRSFAVCLLASGAAWVGIFLIVKATIG